jgi:hypothetical protein
MLGYLYGANPKGPLLNSSQNLGVKVATPVGTQVLSIIVRSELEASTQFFKQVIG